MENAVNTFAKQGQGLADSAADKVQSGIRDASAKVEELRSDAGPTIRKASARAQALGKQGYDAASDFAGRARDAASSTSQAVIDYTKENPVKALLIAAASGALLLTIAKVIKSARD